MINSFGGDLEIKHYQDHDWPEVDDVIVKSGEVKTIETYPGYRVSIRKNY